MEIAAVEASYTGQFLKALLEKEKGIRADFNESLLGTSMSRRA